MPSIGIIPISLNQILPERTISAEENLAMCWRPRDPQGKTGFSVEGKASRCPGMKTSTSMSDR